MMGYRSIGRPPGGRDRPQPARRRAPGWLLALCSLAAIGFSAAPAEAVTFSQQMLPFGGLNHPYGVAVDAAGDVFVADYINSRVVELTRSVPAGLLAVAPARRGTQHAHQRCTGPERTRKRQMKRPRSPIPGRNTSQVGVVVLRGELVAGRGEWSGVRGASVWWLAPARLPRSSRGLMRR